MGQLAITADAVMAIELQCVEGCLFAHVYDRLVTVRVNDD
jgi:hypothetical protein